MFDVVNRAVRAALSPSSEASIDVGYLPARAPGTPGEPGDADPRLAPVQELNVERRAGRVADAAESYMKGVASSRVDFTPQLSLQVDDATGLEPAPTLAAGGETEAHGGLYWQFNNAFIFIQVRRGLVVIDQHAAHERIIYDTSRAQLESEIPVSQQILFPIQLELSLREFEVYRSTKDVFEKLGFLLEPFGGKSVLVRGYPQGLRNWDDGKLLRQIFDDLLQDRFPGRTHADRIIASFACRSAVKAGQRLSVPEMKMLADQLFAVPNPYSCPHGRPTIQRLSLEEIEGWFLRR